MDEAKPEEVAKPEKGGDVIQLQPTPTTTTAGVQLHSPPPDHDPEKVPQSTASGPTPPYPSDPAEPPVVSSQPASLGLQPGSSQQAIGYPGSASLNFPLAAAGSALAHNLPPQQVIWMPAPNQVSSGCPPGLEYLTEIDQVLVHQQLEILEEITNYQTENRYRVRNTLGQQIYFAAEHSTTFQRQCCGPGRAFSISITDSTQREVIHLERPQHPCGCGGGCYCCLSCCAPQMIEVQAPPGTVVGFVKQEGFGLLYPWFKILNADGETVLRIKGPLLGCRCYADSNFYVLSADGSQEVGKICRQWGGLAKEYLSSADNFGIQFPMDLDVKMKAVMVGACFLIDFIFFENTGSAQSQAD